MLIVTRSKRFSLIAACAASLVFAAIAVAAAGDTRLLEAAKNQDREAVKSLLDERADANTAQPDGTTGLAWAAHWDDVEMAEAIIRAGANVDAANEAGVTPLMLAVQNRSLPMAAKLLDAHANPNRGLWDGETPLMVAAATGNVDIINALLAHGADVNAKEPRRGQTALMWAIAEGHPEAARTLIEHGANVRAKTHKFDGFRPMVTPSNGRDIQVTSNGGYTPLLFAARAGDLDTARLLVEKGADVNDGTPDDGSPLVVASSLGHEKLALFLLDKGADPNAKDSNGITPLHYAMRDGLKVLNGMVIVKDKKVCGAGSGGRCISVDNPESIRFLDGGFAPDIAKVLSDKPKDEKPASAETAKTAKPDAPAEDNYGRPKDAILPGPNMLGLAKALLAHGADPNAQLLESPGRLRMSRKPIVSLKGATPFLLAAASKDVSAMKVLAEGRAKVAVRTESDPKELANEKYGDNHIQANGAPLLVAAGLGRIDDFGKAESKLSLDAVKTLIDLGANVNETTDSGWTALHAAAFVGADPVVEYLVSKGADVNARNGCGQTPLSLAAGTNSKGLLQRAIPHPSTTELLRKLGAASEPSSAPVGKCVLGRFGLDYAAEAVKDKTEGAKQK